jgi:hypothetical protein
MQTSETGAPPLLAPDRLRQMATDLVLAMMASATTEKIRPVDWWPRAKTALVAACSRAENWSQLISTMARKLQIETLRGDSTKALSLCEPHADDYQAFVRLCRREAVYIVAQAQIIREMQRRADQ